jgi:hypothetical protein
MQPQTINRKPSFRPRKATALEKYCMSKVVVSCHLRKRIDAFLQSPVKQIRSGCADKSTILRLSLQPCQLAVKGGRA